MKKHLTYKIFLLLAVSTVILVFAGCSATQDTPVEATKAPEATQETTVEATDVPEESPTEELLVDTTEAPSEEMIFTLDELSKFDGQNGNPAYVAVDGVVYDVTEKSLWAGGQHKGNTAGMDLSEEILKSPHGKAKLETLPVVGTLIEEMADEMSSEKSFTLEELSQYDGKNGNPAYIAVDGVVYDVTNHPDWSDGTHHGQTAGLDLTEFINDAPHGTDVLEDLPVVGKLT